MFFKKLLSKVFKNESKLKNDEKLIIERKLSIIINLWNKYPKYRMQVLKEHFLRTGKDMLLTPKYFLRSRFTGYELTKLSTSDSITFHILKNVSENDIISAFDSTINEIAHALQNEIGYDYRVENLHNGCIRITKL